MSYADDLRTIAAKAREKNSTVKALVNEKRVHATHMLYDLITHDAHSKMNARAAQGYNSSNLFEYRSQEYVYVETVTAEDGKEQLVLYRTMQNSAPGRNGAGGAGLTQHQQQGLTQHQQQGLTQHQQQGLTPLYRIYDLIRTPEFVQLMRNYVTFQGPQLAIVYWNPGNGLHVIEAVWGPTTYHPECYKHEERVIDKTVVKKRPESDGARKKAQRESE